MYNLIVSTVALSFVITIQSFNGLRPLSSNRLTHIKMSNEYDYDLIIVGCGVGGHGAALVRIHNIIYHLFYSIFHS